MQKLTVFLFRFYPPFCALLMMHHVFALIVGYDLCIHEFVVDSCIISAIMQWILSKAFRFCGWHRACIVYTYVVSLCVDYQRSIGFGSQLTAMRWIVLISGLVILIGFIIRCRHYNEEPLQ